MSALTELAEVASTYALFLVYYCTKTMALLFDTLEPTFDEFDDRKAGLPRVLQVVYNLLLSLWVCPQGMARLAQHGGCGILLRDSCDISQENTALVPENGLLDLQVLLKAVDFSSEFTVTYKCLVTFVVVLGSRNDEGQNSKHPERDGLDPRHVTLSMITMRSPSTLRLKSKCERVCHSHVPTRSSLSEGRPMADRHLISLPRWSMAGSHKKAVPRKRLALHLQQRHGITAQDGQS